MSDLYFDFNIYLIDLDEFRKLCAKNYIIGIKLPEVTPIVEIVGGWSTDERKVLEDNRETARVIRGTFK